jgi:hypothetical protein
MLWHEKKEASHVREVKAETQSGRPCTCTLRLNTIGPPIDYHRSKKA